MREKKTKKKENCFPPASQPHFLSFSFSLSHHYVLIYTTKMITKTKYEKKTKIKQGKNGKKPTKLRGISGFVKLLLLCHINCLCVFTVTKTTTTTKKNKKNKKISAF